MMTQNSNETTPVRIGQAILSVTYLWQGDKCLGLYFYDASEGYWRTVTPSGDSFYDEAECKKALQGLPLYDENA